MGNRFRKLLAKKFVDEFEREDPLEQRIWRAKKGSQLLDLLEQDQKEALKKDMKQQRDAH